MNSAQTPFLRFFQDNTTSLSGFFMSRGSFSAFCAGFFSSRIGTIYRILSNNFFFGPRKVISCIQIAVINLYADNIWSMLSPSVCLELQKWLAIHCEYLQTNMCRRAHLEYLKCTHPHTFQAFLYFFVVHQTSTTNTRFLKPEVLNLPLLSPTPN